MSKPERSNPGLRDCELIFKHIEEHGDPRKKRKEECDVIKSAEAQIEKEIKPKNQEET